MYNILTIPFDIRNHILTLVSYDPLSFKSLFVLSKSYNKVAGEYEKACMEKVKPIIEGTMIYRRIIEEKGYIAGDIFNTSGLEYTIEYHDQVCKLEKHGLIVSVEVFNFLFGWMGVEIDELKPKKVGCGHYIVSYSIIISYLPMRIGVDNIVLFLDRYTLLRRYLINNEDHRYVLESNYVMYSFLNRHDITIEEAAKLCKKLDDWDTYRSEKRMHPIVDKCIEEISSDITHFKVFELEYITHVSADYSKYLGYYTKTRDYLLDSWHETQVSTQGDVHATFINKETFFHHEDYDDESVSFWEQDKREREVVVCITGFGTYCNAILEEVPLLIARIKYTMDWRSAAEYIKKKKEEKSKGGSKPDEENEKWNSSEEEEDNDDEKWSYSEEENFFREMYEFD